MLAVDMRMNIEYDMRTYNMWDWCYTPKTRIMLDVNPTWKPK